MEQGIILTIVSALLGGATLIFGGKLEIVKRKFNQVKVLLKEAYEVVGKINAVLSKISEILEDKKITPEEVVEFKAVLTEFKNELLDVKVAFLKLIGKG
jgi:hypothetical protein